jgi:RNA polymerase sigma-70 factor (ECF subfamily)
MNDQQQGLFHKKDLDFQAIYAEFQPRILRYVTNMVGDTDAEDLTQEIFIKVSQALPSFHGDSSLSTWLYRIATNAALDRLRSPAYQLSTQRKEQANPTDNLEPEVDDRNIWTGEKVPVLEWQVVRKEIRLHRARERLKADLIANCPPYWVEGNEFLPDLRKL